MSSVPDGYRALLSRVDQWYRSVRERFPDKVTCTRGCRDCCLGLFDISIADRALLLEGLEAAVAGTRKDIQRRAKEILVGLEKLRPGLGEDLDGLTEREVDDLCDAAGPVECPVLGREGECRLYDHRPLICRLTGVPVVDKAGEAIQPEGCAKCTLKAEETPRIDYARLRRQEVRALKEIDRVDPDATMFIAQAVSSQE